MKRMVIASEIAYKNIIKSFPFKLAKDGLKYDSIKGKITRYVLMDGDKILGVVSIAESHEQISLLLFDLEVLPEYRKQGLGTGILETIKSTVKKPISIKLDHAGLVSFYKKAGFSINWVEKDDAYYGYWIPPGFKL
jgi:GNAT superfamily N-acetyltransferase